MAEIRFGKTWPKVPILKALRYTTMNIPPTAGATVRHVRKSAAEICTNSEVVLVFIFFFSAHRCNPIKPFDRNLANVVIQ